MFLIFIHLNQILCR